jgi:hypothetical protein
VAPGKKSSVPPVGVVRTIRCPAAVNELLSTTTPASSIAIS